MAFSGALVHRSGTNQSISNNTNTALACDSEAYDVGGWHDTVTNNSRLTVPSGVSYVQVYGNVQWNETSSAGNRDAMIFKNGASVVGGGKHSDNGGGFQMQNIKSAVLAVTPGDYFELMLWQNSGGTRTVSGSSTETWFAIRAIDP